MKRLWHCKYISNNLFTVLYIKKEILLIILHIQNNQNITSNSNTYLENIVRFEPLKGVPAGVFKLIMGTVEIYIAGAAIWYFLVSFLCLLVPIRGNWQSYLPEAEENRRRQFLPWENKFLQAKFLHNRAAYTFSF